MYCNQTLCRKMFEEKYLIRLSPFLGCRADGTDSEEGWREAQPNSSGQVRQPGDPGPAHRQRQGQGRLRHPGIGSRPNPKVRIRPRPPCGSESFSTGTFLFDLDLGCITVYMLKIHCSPLLRRGNIRYRYLFGNGGGNMKGE
jgi:hypothetical protein